MSDEQNPEQTPKLYGELSPWFHLLTSPESYVHEANFIRQTLERSCTTRPQTLLELGSGGGNNASHLKSHFKMTLVDRAEGMLTLSRKLNPECEHIKGDMRDVRLGRQFDAVFIHDAIMYIHTLDDLTRVAETAFTHCADGGALHILPDCTRESFTSAPESGGHDGDGRSLRYVAWTYDPVESDTTYIVDMAYLLKEGSEKVRAVHDQHVFGLFSRDEWLETLRRAGFQARLVTDDPDGRDTFVGIKPAGLGNK